MFWLPPFFQDGAMSNLQAKGFDPSVICPACGSFWLAKKDALVRDHVFVVPNVPRLRTCRVLVLLSKITVCAQQSEQRSVGRSVGRAAMP